MRTIIWTAVMLLVTPGCMLVDENPEWNPKELPDWTYDAPWYYRPAEDLPVKEAIGPEEIPIYYSCTKEFYVVHPGGTQIDGAPRIAVWVSTDEGQNWKKEGYFGVGQTHLQVQADTDGAHWIRFVGPGQDPPQIPPGTPDRIYVVDSRPPGVTVVVDPPPYTDEEKTKPYLYHPGQTVEIAWAVRDANLVDDSIKLGMGFANFPNNIVFVEIPKTLGPMGSLLVDIPEDAAGYGGIRFRIIACDKADNPGMGLTEVLHLSAEPVDSESPVAEVPSEEGPEGEVSSVESPEEAPAEVEETAALEPGPEEAPAEVAEAPAYEPVADVPEMPEQAEGPELEIAEVEPKPTAPAKEAPEAEEAQIKYRPDVRPEEPSPSETDEPEEEEVAEEQILPVQPTVHKFQPVRSAKPTFPIPRKVGPFDLLHQTQGTPGQKLGWPSGGTLIRGGTYRRLGWLPTVASKFKTIELQFSANDGRSWAIVSGKLKFGKPVFWVVPMVTSKICRLRVVAITKRGERLMLASSPKFTVDTIFPATTLGPTPIPPDGEKSSSRRKK